MRTKIAECVEGYESLELFIDPSENIVMPQASMQPKLKEIHQETIEGTPTSDSAEPTPVPCECFKPRWWPVEFPEEI
ncbi:MAG: hypothetical protein ACJ8FY_06705 [Gemmataceae bacterium]